MKFLEDRHERTIYRYTALPDSDGNVSVISGTPDELREYFGKEPTFEPGEKLEHWTEEYMYAGFDPIPMSITTKVSYDQNGRKAIKVTNPGGGIQCRSMTKERIMETGKQDAETKSVLTKAATEITNKQKENSERKILKGFNNMMAQQASKRRRK